MKVSYSTFTPVNYYNSNPKSNSVKSVRYVNSVKLATDSVSFNGFKNIFKSDSYEATLNLYDKALCKLHDFNKAEYDSLTEVDKKLLREKIENPKNTKLNITVEKDIRYHHFATEAIKKTFDKQYGEGNYVVITLGRSLSSISKLLEMKIGKENVKNIPMSGLGRYWTQGNFLPHYNTRLERFVECDGFENFKKYLSSVGLSRAEVESSNKNYIVMDYASSGNSLESGYTILTSDALLGNSKRNITFASMKDVSDATGRAVDSAILDYYLEGGFFKKYSCVGKTLNLKEIDKTSNYEDSYKLNRMVETIKLFGFSLLDSMYSGKKIPYADIVEINEPVIPYKKVWNSFNTQFCRDIYEDSLEFCKFLNRQKGSSKADEYYDMFALMQKEFRYPTSYVKANTAEEYYSLFRPKLLELLGQAD